jgi:hypothetical protein
MKYRSENRSESGVIGRHNNSAGERKIISISKTSMKENGERKEIISEIMRKKISAIWLMKA